MIKPLTYEEYYYTYVEDIETELAESGATREMDYDPEREIEKRYEAYIVDTVRFNQTHSWEIEVLETNSRNKGWIVGFIFGILLAIAVYFILGL